MLECYEELAAARRAADQQEADFLAESAWIADSRNEDELPAEQEPVLIDQLSQSCPFIDDEAQQDDN